MQSIVKHIFRHYLVALLSLGIFILSYFVGMVFGKLLFKNINANKVIRLILKLYKGILFVITSGVRVATIQKLPVKRIKRFWKGVSAIFFNELKKNCPTKVKVHSRRER
ncbi:hypothetical protein ACRCKS_19190, partial [Acinetobacter baumannii]|uniref:hypothetical protein n=1 Tax=Acinetobacter baumannii TaxID=470 RepID=UPI003D6AA222